MRSFTLGTAGLSIPVGHVDRVAQKRLVYRHAVPFHQHEMDLMDVKRVQFLRPVFDDPVLHVSLLRDDVGHFDVGSNTSGVWPVHGDEEIGAGCSDSPDPAAASEK